MNIELKRREFVKAWKAWRKARAIRAAMSKLGHGRAGPAKAWYDECTVVMRRARRAVMMELREPTVSPWMAAYNDMISKGWGEAIVTGKQSIS